MKNIVPNENCLTEAQLLQYLGDACSSSEEKAIDRHLTLCPMCSDALEGAMLLNEVRLERSLGRLESKIDTRFSDKTLVEQPILPTNSMVDEPIMTVVKRPLRQWLWAAAGVAVLAVAAIGIFTKPMDKEINSTVVADAQISPVLDSNNTEQQTTFPTTSSSKIETNPKTTINTPLSGDEKLTEVNKDVAIAPNNAPPTPTNVPLPKAPTTNTPQADAATSFTEGVSTSLKEAEAKAEDVAVSDNYKNTKKEKAVSNPSSYDSNQNNYSGAASQNNVSPQSKSRSPNLKQSADNALTDYQIGMQFYQKGAFNDAIAYLNRVLAKQSSGQPYQDALWYLANSYLKLDKKQDAQSLLQRIVAEKGKYAQQAAVLLK